MRIGRCEITIRPWKVRIVLHREKEFCHGLIEPPSEEMREADLKERRANSFAGTEAQRNFDMLDRNVGLACPIPEDTADVPPAREARVERQGTIVNRR